MTEKQPLISLKNVSFVYPGGRQVLDAVNLEFFTGNRIGLMGPNGSGKTTLFHIIMGLLEPSSGSVKVFGKPAKTEKDFFPVRQKIGMLFQDPDDQLFSPTVIEDVAFGPLNLGKSRKEAMDIARRTLGFLGLSGFEDRITYRLSGGEKRLVSLATVLAMEPEVLLLDEPTNGLDEATKENIKSILSDIKLSFIVISHDLDFLYSTTDTIYFMKDGKIMTDGTVEIHEHVHAHPHGAIPHEHD
ncbi:MAG: ABC transporter ATP-binding protein [Deltaproteobacteria bacterium]|nr:ABC transporter ATP-binding protein [Deltaproteobacteria bacterium]MBW2153446.1 ABC transporter ATP-binding protein [Deltaproteobacteria bacterium]